MARFVERLYPEKDIDYEKTFSLVVRFSTICLILELIAYSDPELFEIDVKTTFLNGEVGEKIYIENCYFGSHMKLVQSLLFEMFNICYQTAI